MDADPLMAELATASIEQIAGEVARALVRVSSHRDASARLSLPLLYPGGSMVGVEISRLRDGFLVSDAGGAKREASLLGGERTFMRLAHDVATRFGIRFDRNMMFDMDVTEPEIIVAVVAVANAARTAVENTAVHLASVEHADYRAYLWDRLEGVYGQTATRREPVKFKGATEQWDFDAGIQIQGSFALFEIVTPNANAVNSAVTKFLDVSDLGEKLAPRRIAVLTDQPRTPRLLVLGRTARLLPADSSDDEYRMAA
jgi:hypothetical protein